MGLIGDVVVGVVDTATDAVEAITKPIVDMTQDEIAAWMEALKKELLRRQNLALFQSKQTELHEAFRSQGMLPKPAEAEYQPPAESVDAYGVGDVVTFLGVRRQATAGMVVCAPDCDDHWINAE